MIHRLKTEYCERKNAMLDMLLEKSIEEKDVKSELPKKEPKKVNKFV